MIQISLTATPIMILVGQEKSIFAQYLLRGRTWIRPMTDLPKSEGEGYILLAFISCKFSFGRVLINEELDKLNATRQ
jgi:hypothetical protein